jgi:hypothetical protein
MCGEGGGALAAVCARTTEVGAANTQVCSWCSSSFTYASDGRCPICGEIVGGCMSKGLERAASEGSSPPARRAPEPHELLVPSLDALPPEPPLLPPRVLGLQSRGDVVSCMRLTEKLAYYQCDIPLDCLPPRPLPRRLLRTTD